MGLGFGVFVVCLFVCLFSNGLFDKLILSAGSEKRSQTELLCSQIKNTAEKK